MAQRQPHTVKRLIAAGGMQVVLFLAIYLLLGAVAGLGIWRQGTASLKFWMAFMAAGELGAAVLSVEVVRRWILRWPWPRLGWPGMQPAWALLGLVQALGTWVVILILLLLTGGVHWERLPWHGLEVAAMVVFFLPAAAAEEVLFRGFWLSLLAERISWFWAAFWSTLAFSMLHGFNPHWSWRAGVGIFLAGMVFALGRIYTQGLSWPVAFHWGWNVFQGVLMGFPVSGLDLHGPWRATASGPAWWTGGAFGPEAGLVSWIPLLALLWWWGRQRPVPPIPQSGD